jgi:hypothetical protein
MIEQLFIMPLFCGNCCLRFGENSGKTSRFYLFYYHLKLMHFPQKKRRDPLAVANHKLLYRAHTNSRFLKRTDARPRAEAKMSKNFYRSEQRWVLN